ncbi:hypothetical protein [Vibrio sp. WXL103]
MLRRRRLSQRLNKTVSANRRKRVLAANKKKLIRRNNTFVQVLSR